MPDRVVLKGVILAVVLGGTLLIGQPARAIDTGRRCCLYGMVQPVDDWGENFRLGGAVYLKERGQVFAVDELGYVGFFNTASIECAEFDRFQHEVNPHYAYEQRPWGERNFQGVTILGGDESQVLILELPEGGTPAIHQMDLDLMEMRWSLDIGDGPVGEIGGGIAWVPDQTVDGRLFIALQSGDIAVYQLSLSTPTVTYLETFRMPGIDSAAADMTVLTYNTRERGRPEIWAYFKSIDRFYAFELDRNGDIEGDTHIDSGHLSIDRGPPEHPTGLAMIAHPTDPEMTRVFVANGTRNLYEMWWRRGGSRMTECPWHEREGRSVACWFDDHSTCVEMIWGDCEDSEGVADMEHTKPFDDPEALCPTTVGQNTASGCGCATGYSSRRSFPSALLLWGLVALTLMGTWRARRS